MRRCSASASEPGWQVFGNNQVGAFAACSAGTNGTLLGTVAEFGWMSAEIFHVTPITPNATLVDVCHGRNLMVSMYRPDQVRLVIAHAALRRADHGEFSKWIAAKRAGLDWSPTEFPRATYFRWLEEKFEIWDARATAIMPDIPGAPSQLNDPELLDWPFPIEKGLPVYHMDGPIHRLARLLDKYPLVCVAWVGHPKKEPVGCPAYWGRIAEIEAELGDQIWTRVHMLRGVAVARKRPFRRGGQQHVRPRRPSARLSRHSSTLRRPGEVARTQNLH